jgi:hypothetical protein
MDQWWLLSNMLKLENLKVSNRLMFFYLFVITLKKKYLAKMPLFHFLLGLFDLTISNAWTGTKLLLNPELQEIQEFIIRF